MKSRFLFYALVIVAISSFNNLRLASFNNLKTNECGDIPDLNKAIIQYVNEHIKQKVARGECWDLAAEPLNKLGANWDKLYGFGKKIDIQHDCIYPGDIIQFERVIAKVTKGNLIITENLEHHTAIIYEVKNKSTFILAHQNTSDWGKKVGLSEFNTQEITQGTFTIYQPMKN